jgi:hypothetical protein
MLRTRLPRSDAGSPSLSPASYPAAPAVSEQRSTHKTKCDIVVLENAKDDLNRAKANLATWYDGTMDRASGWYKRRTQRILFFIGLITAIALNIDPITIAHRLRQDDALRATIVAEAA